jgi:hypothetical protein
VPALTRILRLDWDGCRNLHANTLIFIRGVNRWDPNEHVPREIMNSGMEAEYRIRKTDETNLNTPKALRAMLLHRRGTIASSWQPRLKKSSLFLSRQEPPQKSVGHPLRLGVGQNCFYVLRPKEPGTRRAGATGLPTSYDLNSLGHAQVGNRTPLYGQEKTLVNLVIPEK